LTLPSRSAEPLSLLLGSPIPWAVPGLSLTPNPLKVRSPPLNRAGLQLPTHTVPEFTPFSCAARSTTTRIPTTHLHQTPAWRWSHRLLSYPTAPPAHCSSGPAEPQLCLRWLNLCPLDYPSLSGLARLQLYEEQLEPSPAGTGTSLAQDRCIHQSARNPAPWEEPAPALEASQITTLHQAPAWATTTGLQVCQKDTHRLDWTLKE
jgi:hypothetical protein